MSLPRAMVNEDEQSSKVLDLNISPSVTKSLVSFGISMPMKDLPSMTSTTLTLETDKDLAKSFERLLI